jgi:hypothetical protein
LCQKAIDLLLHGTAAMFSRAVGASSGYEHGKEGEGDCVAMCRLPVMTTWMDVHQVQK